MNSQQTPINARPKRRPQLPAAAEDVALAFEEQVIWRGEDALRSAGGGVSRGLDRVLWPLQRRLLWPLQDRVRDLDGPGRVVAMATVVLLAAAVGVAGLLWAASSGSGGSPATRVADTHATRTAAPPPKAEPEQPAPTLHGAAPVFKPPAGGDAKVGSAKGVEKSPAGSTESSAQAASSPASTSAATGTISSSPSASSSSAEAATVSGPPAGPAAIAVAREFADAFVVYETGGTEAKVRRAFTVTASHELAHELLRRPPRQPATVKVPRARVVNVVAAPSHGPVYPLSVSLLRVGVTSELRLEMERSKRDGWRVVNALG